MELLIWVSSIKTISAYGCDLAAMESMSSGMDADEPDEIIVEDFAQPGGPINQWTTMNDPVMGGKSYSSVDIERGVAAKFTGYCAVVPSLNAPGFVTMSTGCVCNTFVRLQQDLHNLFLI